MISDLTAALQFLILVLGCSWLLLHLARPWTLLVRQESGSFARVSTHRMAWAALISSLLYYSWWLYPTLSGDDSGVGRAIGLDLMRLGYCGWILLLVLDIVSNFRTKAEAKAVASTVWAAKATAEKFLFSGGFLATFVAIPVQILYRFATNPQVFSDLRLFDLSVASSLVELIFLFRVLLELVDYDRVRNLRIGSTIASVLFFLGGLLSVFPQLQAHDFIGIPPWVWTIEFRWLFVVLAAMCVIWDRGPILVRLPDGASKKPLAPSGGP